MTPLQKRLLVLLIVVGGALRAGWIVVSQHTQQQPDEGGYHTLAVGLAEENVFGLPDEMGVREKTAALPPGWAFLLSGIYRVLPHDRIFGRIFAGLMGTALIGVVFVVGRSLFGTAAGLGAAAFVAVHALMVYWSGLAMTETPFMLLSCGGLALSLREKRSAGHGALEGLVWGMATLVRFTALPFVLLLAAHQWILRKESLRRVAAMLAVWGVLIGAWGWRNKQVFGQFALDLHSGYAIYVGNVFFDDFMVSNEKAWASVEREAWYQQAREEGQNEAQINATMTRLTMDFIRERPLRMLEQTLERAKQFWRLYPRRDVTLPMNARLLTWANILSDGPLFLFALAGLWLGRKEWRRFLPLTGFVLLLMAVHVLSMAQIRYRVPVTPVLAVFAGAALARLVGALPREAAR